MTEHGFLHQALAYLAAGSVAGPEPAASGRSGRAPSGTSAG